MNKKKQKDIIYEEFQQTSIVDETTGEIKTTETKATKRVKVDQEPDFIKLYVFSSTLLNFQKALRGIKERDAQVLYGMLKTMQYDNTIVLDKEGICLIAQQADVCEKTVTRMRDTFIKIQVLFNYTLPDGTISKTRFIVNPHLFGRGKWQDIKEMRALFQYTQKGELMYSFGKSKAIEDGKTTIDGTISIS